MREVNGLPLVWVQVVLTSIFPVTTSAINLSTVFLHEFDLAAGMINRSVRYRLQLIYVNVFD